jgi:hypothetical protein
VILSGLAAGVVANLLDYVIGMYILAEDMAANATRRNLDLVAMSGTPVVVTWVIVDFLYALTIAFTYAAIRPRFGPGPKTAVIAALIPWASICMVMFGLSVTGYWPLDFFLKNTIFSAVVALAIGLTAGALYKES